MANDTANIANFWNAPNFVGELFLIGANKTPFLNMVGGLQQGGKMISALEFDLAQPYALEAASQPAITETASLAAPTPVTYVRGQDVSTVQIFHRKLGASYLKLATSRSISVVTGGANTTFTVDLAQAGQRVANEVDFQIDAHLKQIALQVEYSFLRGSYQRSTGVGVAPKMRGICTACTSNTVAAGAAALTTTMIDTLVRTMAGNGSEFTRPVIFAGAFLVQKLSALYGFAPEDRNVGGVAVKKIITDFCEIDVVWAPQILATTLLLADMSVCRPVFCEVPGKGLLFYEELSKTGAAEQGQIFGLIGLDYGPEEYHGTITNIAN